MQPAAEDSINWGWRDFFTFSEKIIQDAILERQCEYVHTVLLEQLQAQARLWLSEVFYPLPGESIPECVEYGNPPRLVAKAIASKKLETVRKAGKLAAALPLFAHGRLVGAIEMDVPAGYDLQPGQKDFLNGIAAFCGAALALSRQDAVREWRLQQLTLLRQVNLQIARQRQDAAVFQNITDLIQNFNFYLVLLYTLDDADQKLHYRASTGRTGGHPSLAQTGLDEVIPLGKGLVGLAAKKKAEVISPNVNSDSRYRTAPGLPDTSSEASFPLVIEGRLYGVLDVQSDQPNGFHPMDLVVLRILADNVAAALEGVRMVDALNTRSRAAGGHRGQPLLASILD